MQTATEQIEENKVEEENLEQEEIPESEALALQEIAESQKLSGVRKAAILCLSLGEEAASTLFQQLDIEEIQLISRELALLEDVKSDVADKIVDEFNQLLLARNYITMGGC